MQKSELLEILEDARLELVEMLEDLPDETLLKGGVNGDWSIKDILAHLTYWEGQTVTLLFQARQGVAQPSTAHFSAEGVDALNARWHEQGKERAMDMIWSDFLGVRKQLIRRVSELSEAELNDVQRYPWQKGRALWEWIASDSYEHEEEHADQIGAWLEQNGSL